MSAVPAAAGPGEAVSTEAVSVAARRAAPKAVNRNRPTAAVKIHTISAARAKASLPLEIIHPNADTEQA